MEKNITDSKDPDLEWPYPVNYGKENDVSADILILGGGVAGCHAAYHAAKRGAKVVIVEKGATVRSGSGGAGIDHWGEAVTNPCCKITPEDVMEKGGPIGGDGYTCGHGRFITCMESYDALLDLEDMGIKFRDEEDEFKDAGFRDDETKIMFAYDYENKHTICVRGGALAKVAMHKELKKLGVKMYDRVMATGLLTEGGKQGARVIGATGVNIRTGEFYTFRAKATLLSTAQALRMWVFSTELAGSHVAHDDPNCAGDGCAMAWKAGAELALMEASSPSSGPFRYPCYGTGNAHNTWYGCTIRDADGKEIPWVDRDDKVLDTVEERFKPAPGQEFFLHGPFLPYDIAGPGLIPDLSERIQKGEYKLPFYADLPGMPEHERRFIFGLMIGNEGKTRIPVYETYTRAGFDPDKDMLQANVLPPGDAGKYMPWWNGGSGAPQWRDAPHFGLGGLVVDWEMKTNLEGLYAAGNQVAGSGGHVFAAATGRYAARNMVKYCKETELIAIDRIQVEEEKKRVYAPVEQKGDMGWKEVQAGICRIMQDYCGEFKSEETLKMGIKWLQSIRESEAANVKINNPHELARALEGQIRLTVGEMIMHASLGRKASSRPIDFKRIDFPDVDPPEWDKFVTIKLEKGEVQTGELPLKYWIKPPYAPTYRENYEKYCQLDGE